MIETLSPIEEKLTTEEQLQLLKKVDNLIVRGGKIPSDSKAEIKNWLNEVSKINMNTLTGTVKVKILDGEEEVSLVYVRAQLDLCQRDLRQKLEKQTK